MDKKLSMLIMKIAVVFFSVFFLTTSGLTTYFIYRTFDSVEDIKTEYFDISKKQIEDWTENAAQHKAIIDTLDSHWEKSKDKYYGEVTETTNRSINNESRITKVENKVNNKVGVY